MRICRESEGGRERSEYTAEIGKTKGTNKLAETKFAPIKTQHSAKVTQKESFLFQQVVSANFYQKPYQWVC